MELSVALNENAVNPNLDDAAADVVRFLGDTGSKRD